MTKAQIKKGGIWIERELYQSPAFLSLSKNSIKMLFCLLDGRIRNKEYNTARKKGHRDPIKFINLDNLKAEYTKLQKVYGMNNQGISQAKTELLAKGFIKVVNEGGTFHHDASIYALVNDYKNWNPGEVIRERLKDVHRGYQGKGLGAVAKNKNRSKNDEPVLVRHPVIAENKKFCSGNQSPDRSGNQPHEILVAQEV